MASIESQAVSDTYKHWLETLAAHPDWIPQQQTDLIEGWNTLTSEPGGVDYVELDAGGGTALSMVPHGAHDDRVLLSIHGGGFVGGSVWTHRKMFAHLAKAVGARAVVPAYPLLYDGGAFPVPLDRVVATYRWLLDQGIRPEHTAITGDSAGGWLTVMAALRLRDEGVPGPAALLPTSPACRRRTSRSVTRSCCSTTASGWPSWPRRRAST